MRTAPAVHVSVSRFGVWRAAIGAVTVLVWLVVASWGLSHGRVQGGLPPAAVGAAGLFALAATTWFAARLATVRPFDLRWDGRSWHLGTLPRSGATDPVPGELRATIDLGSWLLLHFSPERPAEGAAPHWLPVQRRGLEASWHALRCAVHSPRPAAAPVAPPP